MAASASEIASGTGPHEDLILEVLDRSLEVLAGSGCSYLLIGEIASAAWGRDRGTKDIDVFVRPESLGAVLSGFEAAGFRTVAKDEHWLYKAIAREVEVDVIFRASRDILLDDEMMARSTIASFRGRSVPVAPPEDLIVMKAVAAGEDTARYWYDALGILSRSSLEWPYFVRRSRQHGAKRMLSLLLYAASVDLVVPTEPILELLPAVGLAEDQTP